jgi:hypothetical protein
MLLVNVGAPGSVPVGGGVVGGLVTGGTGALETGGDELPPPPPPPHAASDQAATHPTSKTFKRFCALMPELLSDWKEMSLILGQFQISWRPVSIVRGLCQAM